MFTEVLFQIGEVKIYTHGVFFILSAAICLPLAGILAKTKGIIYRNFFDDLFLVFCIGIVGARISFYLLYPDQFLSIKEIIRFSEGGLVSYGGIVLSAALFALILRTRKQPASKHFDIVSVVFLLGYSIARVGDYFSSDLPAGCGNFWLFEPRYLPLFDAFLGLLLFAVFLSSYLFAKRWPAGLITLLAILLYSFERFIIGFWRDAPVYYSQFSFEQIFLMAIIFASIAGSMTLVVYRKKGRNYVG